jgi:hypothetical protein
MNRDTLNFFERLAVVGAMVLILLAAPLFVTVTTPVAPEQHLFAALDSVSLGKDVDDPRQFCVTTLRTSKEDRQSYCTDFQNVHVYADEKAQGGTYADIDYHIGRQFYSNGMIGLPKPWGDFITVHVQTENERKQFMAGIYEWQVRLYAPRRVGLDIPSGSTE